MSVKKSLDYSRDDISCDNIICLGPEIPSKSSPIMSQSRTAKDDAVAVEGLKDCEVDHFESES